MPAEVISHRIVPSLGQEVVTIMDDFGTAFILQLPMNAGDSRQTRIAAAVATSSANEAQIVAYAAANNIDLTELYEVGTAMKGAK